MYIHVAAKTVDEPRTKPYVIWKSNSTTDAKKDRIIDKLVAKPLRILSEYLMTIAVTSPPKTWIATVAHAHPPKFFIASLTKPWVGSPGMVGAKRIGSNAGNNEKSESCTFRTHKSVFEFLRTISKYTPARPEVKHAAMTAAKPFKGSITCMCLGAAAAALPTNSVCFGGRKLFPVAVCI